MIRNSLFSLAACCGAVCALAGVAGAALAQSAAPAAKPAAAGHAHGRAKLAIAADGAALTLAFESPLDSLVGFEHAPRNDRQRTALRQMEETLQKADALFVPTPAARCALKSVRLASPVLDAAAPAGKAAAHAHGDGHAELEATVVFQCEQPAQLRELEVRLFERFAGLKRIDAEAVGPRGQRAARLSAAARRIGW